MTNPPPPLWIITGDRAAGKTRFCSDLAAEAGKRKIDTAGVLSPAFVENGKKTGFQITNIRSGETRQLAVLRSNDRSNTVTQHWQFDQQNLVWGNEVLTSAVPCGLLIVDELGPLELEQGKGWTAGIQVLSSGKYTAAAVVIRPELLAKALALWPQATVINVDHLLTEDESKERIGRLLSVFNPAEDGE